MIIQKLQLPLPATPIVTVVAHDFKRLDILLTYRKKCRRKSLNRLKVGNPLTSNVRKALSTFPALWASHGSLLQAGFAAHLSTACHLVRFAGHSLTYLAYQAIWRCIHKLGIIPTNSGSTGSHLFNLSKV